VILHTVMPEEFVLRGLDHPEGAGARPTRIETEAAGRSGPVRLVLEEGPDGTWRVNRLVSSDPFDFLDPELTPGRPVPRPPGAG